jgi:hypothetical protein
MKYLLFASLILLTGCQTIVERQFPDVPPSLKVPCENLELVPENTDKLSELLVIVTNNYSRYNECQLKVDAWLEWHTRQKEIFESLN